jgi:hypothetical protein
MVQVLQSVVIAFLLPLLQCDHPDFRYMNSRTDYDLVGNVTNFEQYKVQSMLFASVQFEHKLFNLLAI